MAKVAVRSLSKSFGDAKVLHDIDLEIASGEFVVFVGPSGCGKSTLLRIIAGLEEPTSGDLFIDDVRINEAPPAAREIAMVFQSYALYPHMRVYDNMAFSLKLRKYSKTEIDASVRAAAEMLGITNLLSRRPRELSGGQRQRVAIGRAIVRRPKVFLFDEPLSNLDAELRARMRYELVKLHRELSATMIYVTHDQVEAMTLADRIVVLSAGRIEQVGPPLLLYERPTNMFVASFIGSPKMNFMPGEVLAANRSGPTVRLRSGAAVDVSANPGKVRPGAIVTLGVRPEHVLLAAPGDGQGIAAKVEMVERLGGVAYAYATSPESDSALCVRLPESTSVETGGRLLLTARPDAWRLFDANGDAIS